MTLINHKVDFSKTSRIGLYDNTILCADCDRFLGSLDEFGARIFLHSTLVQEGKVDYIDIFSFANVDSRKLKIFLLSVLWRCSISSREELQDVSLGSEFEDKIRALLLNETNDCSEFSMIIMRYKYTNYNYNKVLFLPKRVQISGIEHYWLFLPNGFKMLIKVDSRDQNREFDSMALKDEGKALIFSFESFEQTKEYITTRDKVRSLDKRRRI